MNRQKSSGTAQGAAAVPQNPWPSAGRLALTAAAGLLLAAGSAAYSMAIIAAKGQPARALAIYPGFEPAATRLADDMLAQSRMKPEKRTSAAIARLARSALRSTALSSRALRQLAIVEPSKAKRSDLVALSLRTSRREPMSLILHAQMRLEADDVDGALADLDRALRVSRRTGPAIYPLLLEATSDDRTREQVKRLLATGPEWSERLIVWTLENPPYIAALAPLISVLPKTSPARAPGYGQRMIDELIKQQKPAEAFLVYATYSPPAQLSDLKRTVFAPIDWAFIDNFETSAAPIEGSPAAVELFASRTRRGEVMRRVIQLPPGRHQAEWTLDDIDGSGGGKIETSLTCLTERGEIGRQDIRGALAAGTQRGIFTVPLGCRYQVLRITISAGESDTRANLTAFRLRQLSEAR